MLRLRCASLTLLLFALVLPVRAAWISPFISEIHYDNAGADVNEFVAVTGPAQTDLSGWRIDLYNGTNGLPYQSVALSGRLGGSADSLAERSWMMSGMQNGPDAVALLSPTDRLVDFVAYEAAVVAGPGTAIEGAVARLIPVAEGGGTVPGNSLQRRETEFDWAWFAGTATPGLLNPGLAGIESGLVPVTDGLQLWMAGCLAWLLWFSAGRQKWVVMIRPLGCRLE